MKDIAFYLIVLLLINFLVIRNVIISMLSKCIKLLRFKKSSIVAKGVIVGHHTMEDLDKYTQYAPVVEYQAANSVFYRIYSDEFKMTIPNNGKSVDVNYMPGEYEAGIVNIIHKIYFKLFLVLLMALILIVINVATLKSIIFIRN